MSKLTMPQSLGAGVSRRHFIKLAGISAAGLSLSGLAFTAAGGVSIIADPTDGVAASAPAQWAISALTKNLTAKNVKVQHVKSVTEAALNNLLILAAGSSSAQTLLKTANATIPATAEAQGLVPVNVKGRPALLAVGHDERGLVYALLELADRVKYSASPLASLHQTKALIEKPANRVRSLNRLFVSNIEDKPWFNDKQMWPEYLTMLATQRYNKFNLSLGIGYDNLQNVIDAYFLFAYPFLMAVPGFDVHVPELADSERDNNLRILRFISEETVKRGMQFQLGLWMHGYEWLHSPNPNYNIKGLNKDNHAAYCGAAVKALLQACPAISGITLRIHGEAGVAEGSYDFWKTIFQGVADCGRVVSIDMHAKGIDDEMLNTALSVGVPITVTPKYWAEHMGMPYHQTDIRREEIPVPSKKANGMYNLSSGSRSFTRYGYGDLLKEDRKYDIVHRIWPGTQRLLLWGDPLTGAAQSHAFSFCGSAGVELMEPLSFKGRRGSGIAGDRCGYADTSLKPHWDWQKYEYSLRVFGRTLYNPQTDADVWHRYLKHQFGAGADGVGRALASATRILPTITTAHDPSAGNNNYWPEMYTNQGISRPEVKNPYYDTPKPAVFGLTSPLDPLMFSTVNECADELLKVSRCGKYSPIDVATWLENHALNAEQGLKDAEAKASNKNSAEYRRMAVDVWIQIGLGRFFAAKMRSGVLFGIYQQSSDYEALQQSLKQYRTARQHWADLAERARNVYQKDVTAGPEAFLRGHWLDRLPAIDDDIAFMAKMLDEAKKPDGTRAPHIASAIAACMAPALLHSVEANHHVPSHFKPGEALPVTIKFDKAPQSVQLCYRHVNQGERFQLADVQLEGATGKATIPAEYTSSPYPLQYYFRVNQSAAMAVNYPGLGSQLIDQPYFVVRRW